MSKDIAIHNADPGGEESLLEIQNLSISYVNSGIKTRILTRSQRQVNTVQHRMKGFEACLLLLKVTGNLHRNKLGPCT